MANYRYLGYGITNDKGIAKLEFDANGNPIDHSYTGTGAGELDIIASLDDSTKISDSSIQSRTFVVLDCILKDNAISSDYTDVIWNNWNNNAIIERKPEYTSITNKTTGTAGSWQISNQPFSNNNLKIEFDVYVDSESQSNVFAQLRNQGYNVIGNIAFVNMQLPVKTWHHIIFEFNGLHCTISNTTNTLTEDRTLSSEVNKFMLRCDSNATETRYKNFRVYPI